MMRTTFLVVVALTLGGHLAALGFEMAAAARFGTGHDADALAFGLALVLALTTEVVGWVATLVIPLYVEARERSAPAAAAFLRRVLTGVLGVTVAGAVALVLAAPAAVSLLAPSLGPRGVVVLRAFAPLVVLLPLAGLFAAARQAHGRFVGASLRQLAWYGGGLAGVVIGGTALGAVAAPLGMLAGTVLFAACLAVPALGAARAGTGPGDGPTLAHVGRALVPLALLSACTGLNVAAERAFAARLGPGSLAALTYAYRLLHFPLALFVINATAMLLPALATHAARGQGTALDALAHRAFRLALVFAVPVAALAAALAEPLTRTVLERGAFTAASTSATATAIAWYAPGVVAMALVQVLFRTFQALRMLWPLAWTAGAGILLNVAMMPVLISAVGFPGLPLSSSLSAFAAMAFMVLGLRTQAPSLARALVSRTSAAVVGAGVLAGVAARIVSGLTGDDGAVGLLAGGLAGVLVYGGTIAMVAREDARAALAVVSPVWAGRGVRAGA